MLPDPADAVDLALQKKLIAPDLPFVRERAVHLLSQPYESTTAAHDALQSLQTFYQGEYPEIAAQRQDDVAQAIQALQEIYAEIVFPDQKLDWETHPDNLGHVDDPGCFRCHDGKHISPTGEAIRLECNLCHAVPVVAGRDSLVTQIQMVRGPEPTSHTHSSWIALHGQAIDSSCAACHPPADPATDYTQLEGPPPADGSFCGNSACHASEWQYAGFDSPALQPILERQLFVLLNTSPYLLEGVPHTYQATFATLFAGRCAFCHGGPEPKGELDLTSYEGLLKGGRGGPAIVPGDPDASLLIQRQSEPRDHFGQVLESELQALSAWIAAGAPER
jgi:hypothetical protein